MGKKKKVFGVTCGRRYGNSEIMLKNVLMGVTEECPDIEVEFCRLQDLDIKNCTGCEACMLNMLNGKEANCVLSGDGMDWLGEKLFEADGIIMTAPIYDLLPPGSFITLMNRGLGYNAKYVQRLQPKTTYGIAIAVGGSDWINFGLPVTEFCLKHFGGPNTVMVDSMVVPFINAKGAIVLDEEPLERAKESGRRMAKAIMGEEIETRRDHLKQTEDKYANMLHYCFAPTKPVCPDCGSALVEWRGGIKGACAICDSTGIFEISDGEFKFLPDTEARAMNRYTAAGVGDHMRVIGEGHKKAAMGRDIINTALSTTYKEYDPIVKPE